MRTGRESPRIAWDDAKVRAEVERIWQERPYATRYVDWWRLLGERIGRAAPAVELHVRAMGLTLPPLPERRLVPCQKCRKLMPERRPKDGDSPGTCNTCRSRMTRAKAKA